MCDHSRAVRHEGRYYCEGCKEWFALVPAQQHAATVAYIEMIRPLIATFRTAHIFGESLLNAVDAENEVMK